MFSLCYLNCKVRKNGGWADIGAAGAAGESAERSLVAFLSVCITIISLISHGSRGRPTLDVSRKLCSRPLLPSSCHPLGSECPPACRYLAHRCLLQEASGLLSSQPLHPAFAPAQLKAGLCGRLVCCAGQHRRRVWPGVGLESPHIWAGWWDRGHREDFSISSSH